MQNDDTAQALAGITAEMENYAQIAKLARAEQYGEALARVKESPINQSTKKHLQEVLESNEKYIIDRTFDELDARIAQAMCWECWGE